MSARFWLLTGLCAVAAYLSITGLTVWSLPATSQRAVLSDSQGFEHATCTARAAAAYGPGGMESKSVVIVGSGLAGLSAAIETARYAQEHGFHINITILEKMDKLGGNSMKASSGINALHPPSGDSVELYENDTIRSGGGLSKQQLVSTLVEQSPTAITFLESLGADLSKLSRLGGHSVPRTHCNPSGPNVGFAIMRTAMAKVQALPSVTTVTKAKVVNLAVAKPSGYLVTYDHSTGSGSAVEGVHADALVLATGGFAASKQLLMEYNAAAAEFATTNGPWATGDLLGLARGLGARLVHMDQVQIHPTGFVDPSAPDAGTKFLAAERLRGVGGVLLNAEGQRFVDELQRRDVVTDEMLKQTGKFAWLVLGTEAAAEFGQGAVDFYAGKKLLVKASDLSAAAEYMSVPEERLRETLDAYNAAAARGSDSFGKTAFPSTIDPLHALYIGRVTPVVHYCMGGLEINERAEVLCERDGAPLPGLFAAGEVSGGLHGRNRLGGNSLLECVVFGRVAGRAAVTYLEDAAAALKQPVEAVAAAI